MIGALRAISMDNHLLSIRTSSKFRLQLASSRFALGSTKWHSWIGSCHSSNLASWHISFSKELLLLESNLLLLEVIIMTSIPIEIAATWSTIFIETFSAWSISWISLVNGNSICIWMLGSLMAVSECILLHMAGIGMGTLLLEIKLTICIVAQLLKDWPSSWCLFRIFVIFTGSLGVLTFLFNYELLSGVGIDLGDLGQVLLLVWLCWRIDLLLLLVLFQAFLTLVGCQLAVWCPFWHAVASIWTFRSDRSTFICSLWALESLVNWDSSTSSHLIRLSINWVLILSTYGRWDPTLSIVLNLWIHHHLPVSQNIHLSTTIGIVLLTIVGCKLVLVL